jgi:hemerythrin-like domain-containing protein
MEATDVLMEEHRIIERLLDSLDLAADRLESGKPVRPGFFIEAAEFIRGFADGCHHRKEEGFLFPALEAAGMPRDGGPVGVMLHEHDTGRALTKAMREAAERLQDGDAPAKSAVAENARGYAALLRQHIQKENMILFRMADRFIQGAARDQLTAAFAQVEREETGAGVHEKYLGMLDGLEREARG